MTNYGLADIATMGTAGAIGSGIIRVFSVTKDQITSASSVNLYNGTAVTGAAFISLTSASNNIDFAQGIRFAGGCYAVASGCTANVSYVTEL